MDSFKLIIETNTPYFMGKSMVSNVGFPLKYHSLSNSKHHYYYYGDYLVGGFNHLETYERKWEGLSRI